MTQLESRAGPVHTSSPGVSCPGRSGRSRTPTAATRCANVFKREKGKRLAGSEVFTASILHKQNVPRKGFSLQARKGLPSGTALLFLKLPLCPSVWELASAVALKCLAWSSCLCNCSSCLPALSTPSPPFPQPCLCLFSWSDSDELGSQSAKSSQQIVYILSCYHRGCFSFLTKPHNEHEDLQIKSNYWCHRRILFINSVSKYCLAFQNMTE